MHFFSGNIEIFGKHSSVFSSGPAINRKKIQKPKFWETVRDAPRSGRGLSFKRQIYSHFFSLPVTIQA